MQDPRRDHRDGDNEVKALDPIALTLAVWLGLVTCTMGLVKLADDAAAQATIARLADPRQDSPEQDTQPFSPRLMAFGG